MLFLSNNTTMAKTFEGLCDKYKHIEIAVAWAGNPKDSMVAKILKKHEKKISKMVVGLHFYQTSPTFIKQYLGNDKVRFMLDDTSGIFHPKVYLFFNDSKDWTAIIGSSNFTYGGFAKNTEANVLIESKDSDKTFFSKTDSFINEAWKKAKQMTTAELNEYEKCHKYQKPNLKSLSKVRHVKSGFDTTEMDLMTWDSYVSKVQHTEGFEYRIALLDEAHDILSKHKRFQDIDPEVKKCLAGFRSTMLGGIEEIDWKGFGSNGLGVYQNAFNTTNVFAKAIDMIPLEGEVTKQQFETYCKVFLFRWNNPLASATRLLCIKRPDTFVCVDSKNKDKLCKAFGIPKNSLTLDTYWEKIVMRVRNASWFNDEGSSHSPMVRKIKKYQVAMLDALYYEGK